MLKKEKQLLFQKQAQVAAALAHPLRIAILDFLKNGPRCVCDIALHIGAERSNVSRHLAIMVSAGLLEYRKEGLKVIYELKAPCILDFFSCINTCLKQELKAGKKLLKVL
jgi:ArsR family transcriptional regulator